MDGVLDQTELGLQLGLDEALGTCMSGAFFREHGRLSKSIPQHRMLSFCARKRHGAPCGNQPAACNFNATNRAGFYADSTPLSGRDLPSNVREHVQ